ncbi:MAG TPA: 16S rRNA (guanine(527)-N(7))-methyltransferase RsmG [Candidatus Merdenecus merdavium]|nr:16S rRNA (guanine(527)-N(7))-methyltransferase RsmG [Candidatus Merdenecus merdavium]
MNKNVEIFQKDLEKYNITLNQKQYEQFFNYYELLIEWNKVMNLTGITYYDEVNKKHFVDSLSIHQYISMSDQNRLIDVGTGAGFPGIPLKIAFPDLEVVLLDSLNKRVKFLNEIISKLQIKGIQAIHGRAEDFAREKEYREAFDLCVSRAVANLSSLSEYCLPFVTVGGSFIPYKSSNIDEEQQAAKKAITLLGGKLSRVEKFCLPDTDMERSLLFIEKIKHTPKQYPRKSGLPTKEPIQ